MTLRLLTTKGRPKTGKIRTAAFFKNLRCRFRSASRNTYKREEKIDIVRYEKQYLKIASSVSKKIHRQLQAIIPIPLKSNTDLFYLRDFCLLYLYIFGNNNLGMSTEAIAKKYNFFINTRGQVLTSRGIRFIIRRLQKENSRKILRTHSESMEHRVKAGEMDYVKRKMSYNYSKRYIDYKKRDSGYDYKFASGLRQVLQKKGISTKAFATKVNVNATTMSHWVNCRNRVNSQFQEKICKLLSTNPKGIFSDINPAYPIKHLHYNTHKDFFSAVYLRRYLQKRKKTEKNLAKHLGVREQTVSRWVNLVHRVSPEYAEEVSKFLNTPIGKIFSKIKGKACHKNMKGGVRLKGEGKSI